MRRRTVALVVCALAVPAAGCGERAEPVGELSARYPVTVTGAGEDAVVLERPPERIVALDRGPAEFVAALGAAERLVGVPAGFDGGGDAAEITSGAGAVRVEAAVRLRPDVILATPATDPVDLARTARRSGAPVYVQPADSVADIERAAMEVGFVIGAPARARQLVGRIRSEVAAVEERVAGVAPARVFVDTGLLVTVPESSLLGDLVRRAGGVSVASANPGAEPLDPCDVARLQPDVLVVVARTGAPPPTARPYACRGELPGRLVSVREETVTVAGPRVARALEAIARVLHPDAFR